MKRLAPVRPDCPHDRSEDACGGAAGAGLRRRDLERRDTRQFKISFAGVPIAGGDEYAISVAANPDAEQSTHRGLANPNRRRIVRYAPEKLIFHGAKREQDAAPPGRQSSPLRERGHGVAPSWSRLSAPRRLGL